MKQKTFNNRSLINQIHRWLGLSNFFTRIAVSMNFHSRKVFKYHFAQSSNINDNGELLLVKVVTPHIVNFVDVGANIGEWTKIVLEHGPQIIKGLLYEPNQECFIRLQKDFGDHNLLTIFNIALGDKTEEKTFFENVCASNLSSFVSSDSNSIAKTVLVNTLDDESIKQGLTSIDFLKIDTEGYDFKVIQGARNLLEKQAIGVIQFEYNRNWLETHTMLKSAIDFLESYNYLVFLLKSDGLYQFRYEWYGEYFEYSNFVAIAPKWEWVIDKLNQGLV
jgi:FkbM family methyltransferase